MGDVERLENMVSELQTAVRNLKSDILKLAKIYGIVKDLEKKVKQVEITIHGMDIDQIKSDLEILGNEVFSEK